ncbi:MAG: hypothetical protein GX442_07525 [Candidatus Riflebacteria bacterium]|nr:hypothetical protein [Candidatus Riflebacteria bacterium]
MATKLAISADDSLLALFTPNLGNGGPYIAEIFDLRAQNFASLTQQFGLISDIRNDDEANFAAPPYVTFGDPGPTLTFPKIKLCEAFTASDSYTDARNYPGNYMMAPGGKYSSHANRFFGYYYPATSTQKMAIGQADMGRFFLHGILHMGQGSIGPGFLLTTFSPSSPPPVALPIYPPESRRFQVEHGEGWSDGFCSVFATPILADSNMSLSPSVYGLIQPSGGSWAKIASTSLRPMRFSPPSLFQWISPDDMIGDRALLTFSRDAANPTLFVLNAFTGGLSTVQWGGGVATYALNAGTSPVGSGTVNNMMVSPDGHRLILTADFPPASGPHQVFFLDISVPATGTYCTVVATQTLEYAPVSLAMRPFNRLHSARDEYTELATLAASVCGNSIGAVGDGGIYLAGGADSPGPAGVATNTVTVLNPITGGNINLGEQLATPAMRHGVVAYDGALTLLNGNDGVATRAYVQQWDTRTKEVLPPQDVADITSTRQSPKMKDYNDPTPYVVACDNYLTKTVWFTTIKYHGWKAMDRDSSTAWYSQNTTLPHNLDFNFGKKVLVDRMDLRGCDDYFPIDFELWGSNDPGYSPYVLLLSKKYTKYNIWWHKTWWGGYWECECNTQTFNISNNKDAYQYYKLKITSGKKYDKSASNQIGVREFSLYGYVPAERPVFDHMASTTRDVGTVYTRRAFQGTALTPYGIVYGGGTPEPSGGATTTVGLYWPHVVASYSLGASDLLCWLKFDETTGNFAFDSSYNGRNGTTYSTSGLPAFVPGRDGNAISLIPGLSQYVALPPGVVDGLTNFTIACWVNLQTNTSDQVVWYFGSDSSHYMWLTPRRSTNGNLLLFGINGGVGEETLSGTVTVPTDGWHHLAFTMSGSNGRLYLDGTLVGASSGFTKNPTHLGATDDNWIGNDQPLYADPRFDGQIDDFVVFSRALSLNEVRALAKTANCIAHLKFDEPLGAVTTANDSSALGTNDGTGYLGPTSVVGNFGNALQFNGTTQYMSLPAGIMSGIKDFSISCWFQFTAANGAWVRIFDFGTGTTYYMMLTVNDGSNRLCYEITTTSTPGQRVQLVTSPTVTFDGNWRHAAITFALASGTNYRGLLYLDGVNIATNAAMTITPDALGNTTKNWLARSMFSTDATLTAMLDDFMIFDGALSPASVAEIFACQAGGSPVPVALTPSSAVGDNAISSSYNGSKAIDGNTGTYYVIDKDDLPATLTIDLGLGNDADVTQIKVDNYNTYGATDRCVRSYRLSGSPNGSTWTVLQANQAVTANTNGQIFTFTNGTPYRYYAFCMLTHNGCSDNAGVNEVTLYGTTVAPNVQYNPLSFPSFVPVPGAKYLEWGISRELPPLSGAVAGHVFVYHKGRLYRIGGSSNYPTISFTSSYDYFDFIDHKWVHVGFSPYEKVHFGACSFGEEIYCFGGAVAGNVPTTDAVAWNPQTNVVRTLKSLPTPRHSPCAVACGPSIYIFGGTTTTTGNNGNTVYQYAP